MKIDEIRAKFPALSETVYGKPLVYLDNAATSQRPESVLSMQDEYSRTANSNIHRGVHYLSNVATEHYEQARDAVRDFINAEHREEIVFTSGTTASINLVAYSFGDVFVKEGDNVVVSCVEHHSNLVPWQLLCRRKGAQMRFIPVDDDGTLMIDSLEKLVDDKTKIVAVTQVSNVLGVVNPVKEIITFCHSRGVPVLVDGAQGIVHCGVNVQEMDCDFYAFSGHKIYAATGTGVLYGKKKFLEAMPPFLSGGEMVGTVTLEDTTFAPLPMKFEAGTQNFIGQSTLKPALEVVKELTDSDIKKYGNEVSAFLYDELTAMNRVRLLGTAKPRVPVFSFSVDGVHHEDLAQILDKMGIAVRSGQMCAEPVMTRFGVTGVLRASLAPYNTLEEAEVFLRSLDKAVTMLFY